MSAELVGILAVGAALGGLVLTLQARTDKQLGEFRQELRRLSERVARLVGLLEGTGLVRLASGPPSPASTSGN